MIKLRNVHNSVIGFKKGQLTKSKNDEIFPIIFSNNQVLEMNLPGQTRVYMGKGRMECRVERGIGVRRVSWWRFQAKERSDG